MNARMQSSIRGLAALLLVTLIVPPIAFADEPEVVFFGGMEVLRIRVGWNGMTPRQRAQATRERLLTLSEKAGRAKHRVTAEDITLDVSSGTPQIRAGGALVLTVTSADAKANNMSLDALARIWHERMREAILRAAPVPVDEP